MKKMERTKKLKGRSDPCEGNDFLGKGGGRK
jgi:hypothetical protein